MIRSADLFNFIRSRRSIRRYTSQALSLETIQRLLAAAGWAPSAHNRQPWRFAVVSDEAAKINLAQAMGQRLRSDRLADGDPLEAVQADVARSYARIASAPAVIAACLSMADMDRYPDDRRSAAELTMAVQSVAMAVQNLLLAAHAENLGACWMCAPLFCPDAVAAALALPEDWQPQALITVGHPADGGRPPVRKSVDAVTLWR